MSNLKETVSIPVQNIQSLLEKMPKRCSCHICEATKDIAKRDLGEKKYKTLCVSLGILH